MLKNIYWKELGLLIVVWIVIVALQIAKVLFTITSFYHLILKVLLFKFLCIFLYAFGTNETYFLI